MQQGFQMNYNNYPLQFKKTLKRSGFKVFHCGETGTVIDDNNDEV